MTVRQLADQLHLECSAGQPFTLTIACTGATVTAGTVEQFTSPGVSTAVGAPTVTTASSTITVAWSAANIDALYALGTGYKATILYKVAGTVNGAGPFNLVAGQLTVFSESQAGTSTSATADLEVTVGEVDVVLGVTLGALLGTIDGGAPDSAYGGTYTIDGGAP